MSFELKQKSDNLCPSCFCYCHIYFTHLFSSTIVLHSLLSEYFSSWSNVVFEISLISLILPFSLPLCCFSSPTVQHEIKYLPFTPQPWYHISCIFSLHVSVIYNVQQQSSLQIFKMRHQYALMLLIQRPDTLSFLPPLDVVLSTITFTGKQLVKKTRQQYLSPSLPSSAVFLT